MDATSFGAFIAECRKEQGLTQDELGHALSVTGKAISRWERGVGYPDISTLEPLAEALGVGLMELMKSEKNKNDVQFYSEMEILNETINYLKKQRKKARIRCTITNIFSAITMIFGIILACHYVDNVWERVFFIIFLIYTAVASSYTLNSLIRI